MNYYMPRRDETCEKKCDDVSLEPRAARIMARRYALTTTEFKFLEIGIRVDPPSYVEIAIRDHRGKQLILSLETWKGLYEQCHAIQNYLNNDTTKDVYNFISVGPHENGQIDITPNVRARSMHRANV
ncbi:uncharacterized protein LOC114929655 [Nylanderia fulva]|uniref:uncharacterized protein LOC114929655 n=1 Tax=Nylanderia fulva TaxID=613905 RepID=UPI0010FB5BF9|nr:uncharacterized protein LOC114929655 [Nylanderia fulva]